MRLRGQYTVVIGGLVCTSLLVLGASLLAEQRRYAHETGLVASANLANSLGRQVEKQGVAAASALAARLVTPLYHNDYRVIAHEASEQRSYPDVANAIVVDSRGIVIREESGGDEDKLDMPWVAEALETGRPVSRRDGNVLHVAAPAVAAGHVLGAAVLDLAMDGISGDIEKEQARLDRLIRAQSTAFSLTGFAIGIVLVTLAVLSAVGVAGGLSGPVVDFAARARRIGRGDLVEPERTDRRDEIGDLSRAFDEMAATLKSTTVSKDYFDSVLRSMADMLLVTDADGRIVTANPSCLAELGCSEDVLVGKPAEMLLPSIRRPLAPVPVGDGARPRWFELKRPDGTAVPVRLSAAPLRGADGRPSGNVLVMQNVSDRLASEAQVEKSLAEKEILLREIHHRVKNNLQIISSMLSLQGERSDDEETREVFHESEVRIRAMALVHEQLYRSGDLAHVDLTSYLETLAGQVIRYFGRGNCEAAVHVDESLRIVSVDQAIPIGLIVNELIANSVQHGLADARPGRIRIEFTTESEGRRLTVADNGIGIPEGFDLEAGDSLGLKLVLALSDQLGGTFSILRDGGTIGSLRLPPAPRPASGSTPGAASDGAPADSPGSARGPKAAA